jgi:molybdenum cofactor cytidylyltransferase
MANISAVILAAGESSRFGQPKPLIEFRGRTLIKGVVEAAKEAGCRPIIVVTGSDSPKVAAAIDDDDICIAENTQWRDGIGTSIRIGAQRLIDIAPEAKAVVLLVCDQPFITGKILTSLMELWSATGKSIVASSYSNTLGVPALFDRALFVELLRLEDETGAKPIILSTPGRVAELPFPEGASDIDTVADYQELQPDN